MTDTKERERKRFAAAAKVSDAVASDAGAPGRIVALFSRFNVIDGDQDVTLPGAFEDGVAVPISFYGHRSGMPDNALPPVGSGTIRTDPIGARLEGKFFDTPAGLE